MVEAGGWNLLAHCLVVVVAGAVGALVVVVALFVLPFSLTSTGFLSSGEV